MPNLVFDPDVKFDTCSILKRNSLYGGGLTGAKRCEYVRLCKLMTSRDPSQDYDGLRDAILGIMREDVTEHSMTLPEKDRDSLLADIGTFFSTIDFSDNPLTIINVVGIQIATLFTKYVNPKNNASQGWDTEDLSMLNLYTAILKDDKWKTYSEIKPQILGNDYKTGISKLLSNDDPRTGISKDSPIFMVFIGFVTLRELMESYFNTVFYLGFTYESGYVDDIFMNPLEVIRHDYIHYRNYTDCLANPVTMNDIKEFHNYVTSTKDKSVQYAINLIFFIILHERDCIIFHDVIYKLVEDEIRENPRRYRNIMKTKSQELSSEIFKYLDKEMIKRPLLEQVDDKYGGFLKLKSFGLAIPKTYRILVEGSTDRLQKEKVVEYINLVLSLYDECHKEFFGLKKGGKRKRLTRKHRVNRKQKKTRQRFHR